MFTVLHNNFSSLQISLFATGGDPTQSLMPSPIKNYPNVASVYFGEYNCSIYCEIKMIPL